MFSVKDINNFQKKSSTYKLRDVIGGFVLNKSITFAYLTNSTRTSRIWDRIDNKWKCSASWKAHNGSIWRVEWANPKFGQVIAMCSYDRVASIWEELPTEGVDKGCDSRSHQWVQKACLVDSRTNVTGLKFAPKYRGLMLATSSSEGIVRVYEAPDVMNVSQWTLGQTIQTALCCSCIGWSQSRSSPAMLIVGGDDPNNGNVEIYEYSESNRKWSKLETLKSVSSVVRDVAFAPCVGRSYQVFAVATANGLLIFTLEREADKTPIIILRFKSEDMHIWRLKWNIMGNILATTAENGVVRMWKSNYEKKWMSVEVVSSTEDQIPCDKFKSKVNPSGKQKSLTATN